MNWEGIANAGRCWENASTNKAQFACKLQFLDSQSCHLPPYKISKKFPLRFEERTLLKPVPAELCTQLNCSWKW